VEPRNVHLATIINVNGDFSTLCPSPTTNRTKEPPLHYFPVMCYLPFSVAKNDTTTGVCCFGCNYEQSMVYGKTILVRLALFVSTLCWHRVGGYVTDVATALREILSYLLSRSAIGLLVPSCAYFDRRRSCLFIEEMVVEASQRLQLFLTILSL
jgi:hypothetical protein